MMHGVENFFFERGRARRRVALLAAALASALLLPLVALTLPPFQRPMSELLRHTVRFGYEGSDQYVRRISLQQLRGSSTVTREAGAIETRHARPGGALRARKVDDPRAPPQTHPDQIGPGSAATDMMERAVSRLANVPVVQSEELVIEHASTAVYPHAESERGVEGRVMVQALIDTTGRVVDVQLLASTGVAPF